MNLKSFLKNEYIYSVISKFFTVSLGLIFSITSARYFGAELKGQMAYVQSVVGIAFIVITFGIHQAYPFYRRKYGKDKFLPIYTKICIRIYGVMILAGLGLSIVLRLSIEVSAIIVLTGIFAYSRVTGYSFMVEHPNRRNKVAVICSFIEVVYSLIVLLLIPRNYIIALTVIAFLETSKAIYYTYWIIFEVGLTKVPIKEYIVPLYKYGFFPMIALLMTTLNYRIDILMLKGFDYITLTEIGVYSLGVMLADKALLISDSVREILLSHLAKGKGEEEVAMVMRLCFPVTVITAIFICVLGKPLIGLLYGSEFSDAYSITAICVFGTTVMTFFKMISQYNIVKSKQLMNVIMLSIGILINVVFNFALTPQMGINGAAIATVIGYMVCSIIFIMYFHRKSSIPVKRLVFVTKEDIDKIKKIIRKKSL